MLRIATFNCENLFSRPRIFRTSANKAHQLFDLVDQLHTELSKDIFDQAEIKKLKKKLQYYVTVQDIRGKHTKAKGASDWLGWIEWKREPTNEQAVLNVAKVIQTIDADIISMVEVENRPLLQQFHDKFLLEKMFNGDESKAYKYIYLIDGNDGRGIDVALMSRKPINFLKSYINDESTYLGKKINTFSRDCLRANIQVTPTQTLDIFINHFKSMGYSPKEDP